MGHIGLSSFLFSIVDTDQSNLTEQKMRENGHIHSELCLAQKNCTLVYKPTVRTYIFKEEKNTDPEYRYQLY